MALDGVLSRFVEDLVRKGHLAKGATVASLDRLSLALTILKTYVRYPLPPGPLVPWNYCALPRIMPWTRGLIGLIC